MGRSLAETPTWSVATVITTLVASVFLVQHSIKRFGKWLVKTKRRALLAALEQIKEELMLFGLLSLLLGHWTILVAKICVKSSSLGARFYPCAKELNNYEMMNVKHLTVDYFYLTNHTLSQEQGTTAQHHYCPEGHEPFASFESLEQLHRLLIVLAITHVSYSFFTVTLAMLKIYSWKSWEKEAREMAIPSEQASLGIDLKKVVIRRQSTFISHHTSHPWSQHKVLIWMLCFIRQFWSSINRADYLALRLGFITNHNLPMSYDFHNYMLRSMEEEFRDIVGISVLLWGYAIVCMFVNIHGTNAYFWLSFIPAILILLVGTKLHHIVSQLALEAMNRGHSTGNHFKPRDGLFWFGRPKLLLWLLQIISFQNAFEMATFLWSLWEIKEPSCFMKNRVFVAIRLASGIIFQFWCSYNTFPLYVIITQMGTRFKKAIVAENVRKSLHGWLKRVKDKSRHGHHPLNPATTWSNTLESMADEICNSVNPTATESITLSDSMADETGDIDNAFLSIISRAEGIPSLQEPTFEIADEIYEPPQTASDMTDETENADNTSSIILRAEVIPSVQESAFEIADEICEQPQTASDNNLEVSFCSNWLYEHFDDGSVDDDHAENDSCLHPLSYSYSGKSNDQ